MGLPRFCIGFSAFGVLLTFRMTWLTLKDMQPMNSLRL